MLSGLAKLQQWCDEQYTVLYERITPVDEKKNRLRKIIFIMFSTFRRPAALSGYNLIWHLNLYNSNVTTVNFL